MLAQCIREGKPYPKAIANAPDLEFGNTFYYVAFNDLGSCRNFERGMIPWTAVKEYAAEHNITDSDRRDMLFEVIREVDVWYLDRLAKKSDDKAKPHKKGKQ